MNVFISVDMEGVSGLVRWADVASTGIDFERNRVLMTEDANAAVAGAFAAGARSVIVEENHGVEDLCVLRMDVVDPRCEVIRGAGRGGSTTMAGLTAEIDVVLLVGHHARAGSKPGIMAHTVSGAFKTVRVNGELAGEPALFAYRAAELGVPVGLVTGDQVVAAETRELIPTVDAVVVKHAYANFAARCIPPKRATPMIRAAAEKAVQRARRGELGPVADTARPYAIEVELWQPAGEGLSANLKAMAEFELVGDRQVRTTAPDMDLGFRRIAYLGYGDRAGLTKY